MLRSTVLWRRAIAGVIGLSLISGTLAGFDPDATDNVVVYWGQNSAGTQSTQERLGTYCASTDYNVIPLAFMNVIKNPTTVNFANAGDNCTVFPGTQLLGCPQIEEDIIECQGLGKTILLSIGGATYNEGGFVSTAEAEEWADIVWTMFGPVTGSPIFRPFGEAVVDGFDLDFEAQVQNMVPFATQLRSNMDMATDEGDKPYFLSVAPQCPYPDLANDALLQTVYFDFVAVQFYNNYCGANHYTPEVPQQNFFNFDTWDEWASDVSVNPDVKVLLGLPGSGSAAGQGYVSGSQLDSVIEYSKTFPSFGGVMIWDMSQAVRNTGFLDAVKAALEGEEPEPTGTGTATGTATSTVGTETSTVGTETSTVGTETSTVGTETSTIGTSTSISVSSSSSSSAITTSTVSSESSLPGTTTGTTTVISSSSVSSSPTIGTTASSASSISSSISSSSTIGSSITSDTTLITSTISSSSSISSSVSSTPSSVSSTPSSSSSPSPSPSPTLAPALLPQWAQCGGIGYTGPTQCQAPYVCKYFGPWWSHCDVAPAVQSSTPSSPIPSPTPSSTISPSPSPTPTGPVPEWGQCGGQGYTGPTTCAPGLVCLYGGEWWSHCVAVPGGSGSPGTPQVRQWGQCGGMGYYGPTQCLAPFVCVQTGDWWAHCV